MWPTCSATSPGCRNRRCREVGVRGMGWGMETGWAVVDHLQSRVRVKVMGWGRATVRGWGRVRG